MANEDKKDGMKNQNGYEPEKSEKQEVLGDTRFSEDVVESSTQPKPSKRDQLKHGVNETSTDKEVGSSFMRKFLNRNSVEDEDESIEGARVNKSPLFDENLDSVIAEESTRQAPMHLLGEDDSTETTAARLFREKDHAAMEPEDPKDERGITNQERSSNRNKNRAIGDLSLGAIAALLIFFAPNLQEFIFKTQDNSLIFNSPSGLYGPRAGVIEILLGVFALVMVISTFFGRRKTSTSRKGQAEAKRHNPFHIAGLIMLVLIPLGFASLFKFTEFRNDNIRFSSLFNQNEIANYSQVQKQTIYNEGNDIFYTLQTSGSPETTIKITDFPVEAIKKLDLKLPVERNVSISTEVINKMVEREIYTRDETLRLFINK